MCERENSPARVMRDDNFPPSEQPGIDGKRSRAKADDCNRDYNG